ncbi:MAG: DUF1640 domain-containing protein [Methylococcaceae bacterium]|nr:DUF1640 domain-containing protein [Methylococcaceae bacterium]
MASVTFDTHKFIRKLREAGFDERQAEGISDALRDVEVGQELATRRDVEAVRQEVRESELRMDTKLESIHGEMKAMKWMLGVIVGGIIAIVVKTFFPG